MTALKKIKIIPVLIGLAGMMAAVYLYLDHPGLSRGSGPLPAEIGAVPDVFLTDIRQTTYENGSRKWTLEATSARLIREEEHTTIKDLMMTVYAADGAASEITADEGIFFTKTGKARISGNVVIDNGTFQIHTRSLQYREKPHTLSSSHPVRIESDSLRLTGDKMIYDLRLMKAVVEGSVEGRF